MVTAPGGNATAETGVGEKKPQKSSPVKHHFIANSVFCIFSSDLKKQISF